MDGTDSVSASQVFAGDAAAFLAHEADLLDAGRFDDWLDLFDEDGLYWVPSSRDQTDMDGQVSIMLEDKPLLKLRITRLSHPRAHSVLPPPATVHMQRGTHRMHVLEWRLAGGIRNPARNT